MAFAIMRIEKIKSTISLVTAERHGKERMRLRHLSYPERSKENSYYIKNKGLTLLENWKEEGQGLKRRSNSVLALEIILSFSDSATTEINKRAQEWRNANMRWLSQTFTHENILYVREDLDESVRHLHAFIIPRFEGSLNAKHYTGGKKKLIDLQDTYAEAMKPFGLQRGQCYDVTDEKKRHISLKQYYRDLELKEKTKEVIEDIEQRQNSVVNDVK